MHLVILIHEIGHFIACKLLRIGVEEVSIGIGQIIFSIPLSRSDEARFYWRLVPIFGWTIPQYKENLGWRSPNDSDFCFRPASHRLAVVLGGIILNVVVAATSYWLLAEPNFAYLNLLIALISLYPRKGSDGHEAIKILRQFS